MKICILMGSPRKNGNTDALLSPFVEELDRARCAYSLFRLYDLKIAPCIACRACQQDWSIFGCRFKDDLQGIFEAILDSGLTLLATPIYSFFCTAPMKAALDRLVYGMNKYYGEEKGPALWAGKNMASIVTCGYRPENGADLFEEGIRRYCKHSRLRYLGMLAERHLGYKTVFMDEGKEERSRLFARKLLESLEASRDLHWAGKRL
ncbi:MAG: flavodoxin family protein [Deltaproteobacteria bacterium]|jgi:multimeric flavodoxin WrbA|nr:flavodoxin family protein [Deltaproteobacteria bacterium]